MTGPTSPDGRQDLRGWKLRDYDELIARLARSRESQRVSQADLAWAMGYTSQVGAHYVLTGKREPAGHELMPPLSETYPGSGIYE
jgi:hypothetical protein